MTNTKWIAPVAGLLTCLLFVDPATAQEVKDVRASFDGEKVIITYDLKFDDPTQKFKVALYSSHNNYERPLSLLLGDQGDNVVPGERNRVIWDTKSALPPDFDSDLTIKVKATKIIPVVTEAAVMRLSMKPFDKSVIKKGKTLEVKWVGGRADEKINIDLFKDNVIQQKITETENKNHYSWTIPKKNAAGKNYVVRISKADNPTEVSNSQFFQIKPRTSFFVKILPVLAIGGAVAFLSGSKTGEDPGGTTLDDLPGPVKPN